MSENNQDSISEKRRARVQMEQPRSAVDPFLHEMQETLKTEIDQAHRFLSLGAYASANKAGAKAELLEHIINRYKKCPKQ